MNDYLIVGAGLSGVTLAERLASSGFSVLIIDRRINVAGNAYDYLDSSGVLVHKYGPHIFHTNSQDVFDYLSKFTEWRQYEHRVLAYNEGKYYPIPINKTTVNSLYGLNLDEKGIKNYYEKVRIPIKAIRSSKDVVLNSVGTDLYQKFFEGYTRKQWGMDASQLKAGVAARIPVRTNDDDRYFTDTYQAMPMHGYTKMIEHMLGSNNIKIELGVDYLNNKEKYSGNKIIYTGPIDEYFSCIYGKLPYRSLRFKHEHIAQEDTYQRVGTINYPNNHEYTRTTEFKHLTGQKCKGTSIVREYPKDEGDPYYPIPTEDNDRLYRKYKELAKSEKNVFFTGRLATYKYYNMDQVVAASLKLAKTLLSK